MKYLGFWVTWNGIYLVNKKVEAIVNMMQPNNIKLMRVLICLVNYYRNLWARQSHLI